MEVALAVQGGEKKEKEAWEVGEWKRGRLRLAVMMGIYATEFTLKGNAVHEVSAAGAASAAHLGLEHCLLGEPQRGHCLLVSGTKSTAEAVGCRLWGCPSHSAVLVSGGVHVDLEKSRVHQQGSGDIGAPRLVSGRASAPTAGCRSRRAGRFGMCSCPLTGRVWCRRTTTRRRR